MYSNLALPTKYLDSVFQEWSGFLKRNELCSVICVPFSGREYRIQNFQNWMKKNNLNSKYIHIKVEQVSHPEDIQAIFESTKLPIIFSPAETLLSPESENILAAITHYKQKYNRGVLLFFEASLEEIRNTTSYNSVKLLQNISFLPLLNFENSHHFIQHLAGRWNLKISEKIVRNIYSYTGGQMWLIKEILRQYSDKPQVLTKIFYSKQMKYKKQKFWQLLPKSYKKYFRNKKGDNISDELQALNLTDSKSVIIPEFILEYRDKVQIHVSYNEDEILFNQIPISHFLSKSERIILRSLLEAPETKISRNTLAKKMWGSDSEYSDWALDKAISRLRKKLEKLGIPQKNFVTIRDYGYQLLLEGK